MRMVDSMETSYSMHGHTRSLSSIASTILPIGSDTSTYTSMTASPMEPHDLEPLPIELKIPLPSSSCCSEQDFQALKTQSDVSDVDKLTGKDQPRQESKGRDSDPDMGDLEKDSVNPSKNGPETVGAPITSLQELAELADLENYQKIRVVSASSQSDQLSIAYGIKQRLCSTFKIAYGNLIDQYKSDDQAGFAGLYESLEKLKETCGEQAERVGAIHPSHDSEYMVEALNSENSQRWIQQLPGSDQNTALDFLTWIRNDPNFLANRITLLSPSELAALTSSYHPAGVDLSVLANHSHGMTQFYSQDSQMMKLSRRMDNIQHFHDQDPFFTLMYCLFDAAAKPSSPEYVRRNDVWSSVCARIITHRKPGADELIIAVADAFMSFENWELKPRMEAYLQTVLTEGYFLVDPLANSSLDLNESLESKNDNYALRVTEFFDKALRELFDLIASAPHGEALPRTARHFVQTTTSKIQDPQLQVKAKDFLISRWYFASFLSSVLVYPELAGLLMTQHIGESARQNILKQIVIRMQLQVFDVLSSRADEMLVPLERRLQILAISDNFEPAGFQISPSRLNGDEKPKSVHDAGVHQVMLSHQDLSGLIRTLYPNNPLPVDSTESSSIPSASAPPSTTSSSTLHPEFNEVGSCASSVGPNYSSSSVSSDVTVTGHALLPPEARTEILSTRSFPTVASGFKDVLDLDVDQIASRLWTLHGKLHAIARKVTENDVDSRGPSRWAIFQVRSNGTMALNATSLSSGSLARNDVLQLSSRSGSNYATLKEAIITLLTTPSCRQLPSVGHNWSLEMVQESLKAIFEEAMASSRLSMDFLHARYWHHCLEIYSRVTSAPDGGNLIKDLFADIARQFRRSIFDFIKQAEVSESLNRSLLFQDKQLRLSISTLESRRHALRIKMWYIYDVKHSSTYEEALLVAKSLRAMSSPKRSKQAGGTFSWARQRLRGTQTQERAEAQTLEAMTAPKDRGGRRKLADEQVEMTSRWLTRNEVENFCMGEERIHRYCYEVQKSVGRLAGASLLESPVLWSSHLFKREKASLDARNPKEFHSSFKPFNYGGSRILLAPGQYGLPPISSPVNVGASTSVQSAFTPSIPPSVSHSALNGISYPSNRGASATTSSLGLRAGRSNEVEQASLKAIAVANEAFVQNVRNALYGLLASDLGYLLWAHGSETDAWIHKAALDEYVGGKSASETVRSSLEVETGDAQHIQTNPSSTQIPSGWHGNQDRPQIDAHVDGSRLECSEAYQALLHKMSTTHDPFIKLEMIWQLERLVVQSIQDASSSQSAAEASTQHAEAGPRSEPMSRTKSVPRTQTTSLEEVIANCTERREEALRVIPPTNRAVSTDAIVNHLLTIFRSPDLRPPNLFLSLQYIAAFIPVQTLDHTPQGEAFWNCSLAALALKEDLCTSTVRRAAEITNAHISSARLASPPYPSQQEAANLWLIAAKEGSPVAARELGLFYLTLPLLLPQRVTKPLSRGRDVFKSARGGDGCGAAGGDDSKERGGLNPLTFDVVYHWMEIAANGGDAEAKAFLKQGTDGG